MRVLPPFPWTEFTVAARPLRADLIAMVNRVVNAGIRPAHGVPGVNDLWRIWPEVGWCHDYALTKREELSLRGIASASASRPDNEHHMVLLVDGVALDNLTAEIRPMAYAVVRTQSPEQPDVWET